jgi:predicted transcriptional regulator
MHKIINIRRGKVTGKRIAEVFEILNDGQWHSIDEIQSRVKLNEGQSKKITDFLSEYDFITVDDDKRRVKLKENVRKFLAPKVTP